MPKILIDTDAYIDFLKTGRFNDVISGLYTFRTPDIHFSSVVAEELLQGAKDGTGRRQAEALYRPFQKTNRFVSPDTMDWLLTGHVLSKIREKNPGDRNRLSLLVNDTLIAMTARHVGAIVYTSNRKDFELIAQVQPFHFQIIREK